MLMALMGGLVPGQARAQNCAQPPPTDCGGVPFAVVDATTGQEVQALCVGRPVRFVPCASRAVSPDLTYYTALPGTDVYPPGCLISPTGASTVYRYTPTAPGPVTISENANTTLANGGVIGTFYTRVLTAYATVPPPFTIAPCPAGVALVTVTDAVYDRYTVRAGSGPEVAVVRRNLPQVVALAGATTVTVTGYYALVGPCTSPNTQTIPALAPPQVPALNTLALSAPAPTGELSLGVGQLPTGYTYTLQRAPAGSTGPFQNVADVPPGSTSVALPNAPAGGYRVLRTDNCQTATVPSATRYTLGLAVASSAQGRIQLLLTDANPSPGPYAVTRNGVAVTNLTAISGGLEDANVVCGTRYTYRVSTDGGAVLSNEAGLVATSTVAPPTPRLVASFNLQNLVTLTPSLPGGPVTAGGTLRYRRLPSTGPVSDFLTATSGRTVTDSTAAATLTAVCYSLRLTDLCGNTSAESGVACPSILTARALDDEATAVALNWSAFTGPDPAQPVAYTLQALAPDGTVLATAAPTAALSTTDNQPPIDRQVLRYRLQISGAGIPAGTFSYSSVAQVPRRARLLLPNAFTPNGDGLNDVFEVKGRFLDNFVLIVVDRNGQQVFRATNRATTWDGTINGHAPVNGVYIWRFEQTDEAGQFTRQTGTVTLLK
ncbi:gliding motility-associated C-terminal domain-containing protein [Hymenobacter nivis]|uniref:Gliding motility-associated C-terminal domain-containing protein n=1 Tax=Hymenobacter nivis TaxID=1850093 RepID=A0A502G8K9_9BACT|nr:gliding motility-associated C-terminal domain-containing protein [Hymenobacter nivis]